MGVTNQEGLNNADGILGLSPPSKNGQSFVESLKAQGIINTTMFSFYLTKREFGSKFSFGGYLEEYIKPNSSLIWNSLVPHEDDYPFWQVEIKDLIFQNSSLFSNKYTGAMLYSGSKFITIPY
jgi:hypothetical protein